MISSAWLLPFCWRMRLLCALDAQGVGGMVVRVCTIRDVIAHPPKCNAQRWWGATVNACPSLLLPPLLLLPVQPWLPASHATASICFTCEQLTECADTLLQACDSCEKKNSDSRQFYTRI